MRNHPAMGTRDEKADALASVANFISPMPRSTGALTGSPQRFPTSNEAVADISMLLPQLITRGAGSNIFHKGWDWATDTFIGPKSIMRKQEKLLKKFLKAGDDLKAGKINQEDYLDTARETQGYIQSVDMKKILQAERQAANARDDVGGIFNQTNNIGALVDILRARPEWSQE